MAAAAGLACKGEGQEAGHQAMLVCHSCYSLPCVLQIVCCLHGKGFWRLVAP